MFRLGPVPLILLTLVFALGASLMVFTWLEGQGEPVPVLEASQVQPKPQVAVAGRDLEWGTTITTEMVQLREYPPDGLPEGAFSTQEQLEGRIVLMPVKRNEPILESKLAPLSLGSGKMVALMDPKKRAMAVKVDEVVGVAGFINPGDRVDVLVTIQPGKNREMISKMVLENSLVLATGTEMERKSKDEPARPVKVMTLEVAPEEAERLALAATRGRLRLALRSPLNGEPVLTNGETARSVLAAYRKPRKARSRRPPKQKVEVIKGTTVSKLKF